MRNRPLVAVSQRIDHFPDRGEIRDALDSRLGQFLIYAGFTVVPVPNYMVNSSNPDFLNSSFLIQEWLEQILPDAIVLSGGNDIGSIHERDLTEHYLLDYANKFDLPVLGICRGMQMMGIWAGSSLIPVQGHIRTRHLLRSSSTQFQFPSEVNSFHGWVLRECPSGFEGIAQSDDGNIEAIRSLQKPWQGWMWHPERETVFSEQDLENIRKLFSKD